jgi:alkylation response protein AidB-like acyl-CoA dehydrogenase
VRTDPEAPKHRGISYFMVKMDTPGITVRPIQQMHDQGGFTETFYEDVRVPASNMIGDYNRGWYVSTTTLDFERSGVARTIGTRTQYSRLLAFAQQDDSAGPGRKVTDNDLNRHSLADTAIEMEVGKFLSYRVAWMQSRNLVPNYESSMQKMFGSETAQRNARRGINMLGLRGALRPESPHAAIDGRYCMLYMSSVSLTIAAGTSEIQRNIIATRGLGLPRG